MHLSNRSSLTPLSSSGTFEAEGPSSLPIDLSEMGVAILSGGAASRAGGVNKSFLPFDGKPIIQSQLERLRPVFENRIFIVTDRPNDYASLRLPCCPDVFAPGLNERSPVRGLLSALSISPWPWVFLLACDMPLPDTNLLRAMIESAHKNTSRDLIQGGCLVTPDGLQPFHAFYNTRLSIRSLLTYPHLQSGKTISLSSWIESHPGIALIDSSQIEFTSSSISSPFTNLNSAIN